MGPNFGHLMPIPDLRGSMNYPANSQGTPFRSTNMETKQPVSSAQMGSNALRSDQHFGVAFSHMYRAMCTGHCIPRVSEPSR